jgi:hypothetical protein
MRMLYVDIVGFPLRSWLGFMAACFVPPAGSMPRVR